MLHLSCHCGNIKITLNKLVESLTSCNCSICKRYGSLWGNYKPNDVSINLDPNKINKYSWGDKNIEFNSCSNCACITHYNLTKQDDNPTIGINFRMAEEDISQIKVRKFDGANTWKFID